MSSAEPLGPEDIAGLRLLGDGSTVALPAVLATVDARDARIAALEAGLADLRGRIEVIALGSCEDVWRRCGEAHDLVDALLAPATEDKSAARRTRQTSTGRSSTTDGGPHP